MKIYLHVSIEKLHHFYGDLLFDLRAFRTIKDHLAALSDRLYEGVLQQEDVIFKEINNYHKDYLGVPIDQLKKLNLGLEDCQKTIANEYGFTSWANVIASTNLPYNFLFENAVNDLLAGRIEILEDKISKLPDLLIATSQYGHQASLLHYTASNGVEMWRQQVPENLPAITELLLSKGAKREATMKVYGGEFDTLALLETSAHPKAAGILPEMSRLLK